MALFSSSLHAIKQSIRTHWRRLICTLPSQKIVTPDPAPTTDIAATLPDAAIFISYEKPTLNQALDKLLIKDHHKIFELRPQFWSGLLRWGCQQDVLSKKQKLDLIQIEKMVIEGGVLNESQRLLALDLLHAIQAMGITQQIITSYGTPPATLWDNPCSIEAYIALKNLTTNQRIFLKKYVYQHYTIEDCNLLIDLFHLFDQNERYHPSLNYCHQFLIELRNAKPHF